eukprot:6078162-Amphidinium_carterae.2
MARDLGITRPSTFRGENSSALGVHDLRSLAAMAAAALAKPPAATSATGVLSLLEEQENSLRVAALERLNEVRVSDFAPTRPNPLCFNNLLVLFASISHHEVVDQFWHEVADYLTDIEQLYEDASFPGWHFTAVRITCRACCSSGEGRWLRDTKENGGIL